MRRQRRTRALGARRPRPRHRGGRARRRGGRGRRHEGAAEEARTVAAPAPVVQRLPRAPPAAGGQRRQPAAPPTAPTSPGGRRRVPHHPPEAAPRGPPEHADGRRRRPDRRLAVPLRACSRTSRASRRSTRSASTSRASATTSSTRASPSCCGCGTAAATRWRAASTHDGYSGTAFKYLAANVTYKDGVMRQARGRPALRELVPAPTGRTVLPPTAIKTVEGHQGRLHRHDARGHARAGRPGRHPGRRLPRRGGDGQHRREASSAKRGVKAIVVLLHEGGLPPTGAPYDYTCTERRRALRPDRADRPGPVAEDRHGRDRPHPPAVHVRDRRPGGQAALGHERRRRSGGSSPTPS